MANNQARGKGASSTVREFGRTVFDDIRRGDIHHTLKRDARDLYAFYLDEETRMKLAAMGRFKRALFLSAWLFKSLIMNLAPARRLMLLVSVLLFLVGDFTVEGSHVTLSFHFGVVSFVIILLILMLELKDKLLARDELEVGRAVQLALLPSGNPELAGWSVWLFNRPANDVGGDLVDYIRLDGERLGLALGDVSGKGLGAALLMAKLQATLRALAPSSDSLSDLGARMNAILCRDGLANRFATLVYLEVGPGSGAVRLLNAGHPPPIVLSAEGLATLPPVAPLMGVLPGARYDEQTLELKTGETLIVYSDGLTEAMNEGGDLYGDERLEALLPQLHDLSPALLGPRLVREVEGFTGDAHQSDDLSLVILKRLDA